MKIEKPKITVRALLEPRKNLTDIISNDRDIIAIGTIPSNAKGPKKFS